MKNIEHFASEVIKLADMPLGFERLLGCVRRKTLHDYLKVGDTEDSSIDRSTIVHSYNIHIIYMYIYCIYICVCSIY